MRTNSLALKKKISDTTDYDVPVNMITEVRVFTEEFKPSETTGLLVLEVSYL